jgi:hypothetical protein
MYVFSATIAGGVMKGMHHPSKNGDCFSGGAAMPGDCALSPWSAWAVKGISVVAIFMACADLSAQAVMPPPPDEPDLLPSDNPTAVSDVQLLRGDALAEVKRRAEQGDRDAAFRLAGHYMSAEDREQEARWMEQAAKLGHPVAQYNVWFDLSGSTDCRVMRQALQWIEASAAGGFEDAVKQVDRYRAQVAHCGP